MVRKQSPLVGGRLCLDFVNTVSWRGTEMPRDNIPTYRALVRWGERAGALSRDAARAARAEASTHPERAAAVLERAHALRDAMYRSFVSWKQGETPRASDIALVNACAPARAGIGCRRGRFEWAAGETAPLETVLAPIVWSAGELLVSGEPRRLRSCASGACGWLFYDESKSGRRRWCSMSDCGNRAKAKRFYARTR